MRLDGLTNAQSYAFVISTPSVVSIAVMPAANSSGSDITASTGMSLADAPTGHGEHADLRRRVEAEAEQQAERIHLPAVPDDTLQPAAEQAVQQAALPQQLVDVRVAVRGRACAP